MEVNFHPEAQVEMIESARYYEGQRKGLGTRFLLEVERCVGLIEEAPQNWPLVRRGLRRFLMNRFPHSIIYELMGEQIVVVAVAHHSRMPDYWEHRLKEGRE